MPRKVQNEVTIIEPMTLEDLRWLVDETQNLPPDSKVLVKEHRTYADPREQDEPAEITVRGKLGHIYH